MNMSNSGGAFRKKNGIFQPIVNVFHVRMGDGKV